MKRLTPRRPSPGTAIACLALFVSLGGVSYGFASGSIDSRELLDETIQTQDIRKGGVRTQDVRNDTLRTEDIRNNEVRGLDIRNSTIRGIEVALNSLTGSDVDESTLTGVNASTLGGQPATAFTRSNQTIPFSVGLLDDEVRVLASNGQVSITAECQDGPQDQVRLLAATTGAQGVLQGEDDFTGTPAFLTSATPAASRELASLSRAPGTNDTEVTNVSGIGFVAGPDRKGLHIAGESMALGLNYAGFGCFAAGLITATG